MFMYFGGPVYSYMYLYVGIFINYGAYFYSEKSVSLCICCKCAKLPLGINCANLFFCVKKIFRLFAPIVFFTFLGNLV